MEDLIKYYSSDAESAMDLDVPLMFLSFPSAKDPNWKLHPGRENKSTMALVTISKWEWFNQWKVKNFVEPAMFSFLSFFREFKKITILFSGPYCVTIH